MPSSLVRIVHGECDLGPTRLQDDVACSADDRRSSIFLHQCHESDVIDEIHVHEEVDLLLREAVLEGEEALKDGLLACTSDCREHAGSVLGPEGADLDAASIAQRFDGRVVCCVHHRFLADSRWAAPHPSLQNARSPSRVPDGSTRSRLPAAYCRPAAASRMVFDAPPRRSAPASDPPACARSGPSRCGR